MESGIICGWIALTCRVGAGWCRLGKVFNAEVEVKFGDMISIYYTWKVFKHWSRNLVTSHHDFRNQNESRPSSTKWCYLGVVGPSLANCDHMVDQRLKISALPYTVGQWANCQRRILPIPSSQRNEIIFCWPKSTLIYRGSVA